MARPKNKHCYSENDFAAPPDVFSTTSVSWVFFLGRASASCFENDARRSDPLLMAAPRHVHIHFTAATRCASGRAWRILLQLISRRFTVGPLSGRGLGGGGVGGEKRAGKGTPLTVKIAALEPRSYKRVTPLFFWCNYSLRQNTVEQPDAGKQLLAFNSISC